MSEQPRLSAVVCEALAVIATALVEKKTRGEEIVRMCGRLHAYVHTLANMDTALAHGLADVQVALRDVGEHLRFFDDYEEEDEDGEEGEDPN